VWYVPLAAALSWTTFQGIVFFTTLTLDLCSHWLWFWAPAAFRRPPIKYCALAQKVIGAHKVINIAYIALDKTAGNEYKNWSVKEQSNSVKHLPHRWMIKLGFQKSEKKKWIAIYAKSTRWSSTWVSSMLHWCSDYTGCFAW
jgi:hypothetical protein